MDRKFTYRISGVTDEKSLVSALLKRDGVVDCAVEDGRLTYVLDEHADEYPVLIEANELCAKYGGELIIGDEDVFAGGEGADDDTRGDGADEEKGFPVDNDDASDGASAKKNAFFADDEEDYNEVDKIVSKKKKYKQETYFKIGELAVSLALFVACLLIKGDDAQFGFKTILAVLAFAIGGYEIFYAAINDLVRKKFFTENTVMTIAAIMGALLGYVVETTALVVAFAAAKAVETATDGLIEGRIEETFYTGSVEVACEGGGTKKIADIAVGDVLDLKQYDVLPCDGLALSTADLDTYRVSVYAETAVNENDAVKAGSVVLSDGLKMRVTATNAESALTVERARFVKSLEAAVRPNKVFRIINLVLLLLSIAATFIMPAILGGEYSDGMRLWGGRAIAVISATMILYVAYLADSCVKNAMTAARYQRIRFASAAALEKLGTSDEFAFNASTLTENGAIKEDAYGCMNELLSSGVKNVSVVFDTELSEEVKGKLTFRQKPVKKGVTYFVGKDLTLSGEGDADIIGGELSLIPPAYRAAKSALRRKTAVFIIAALCAAGVTAGLIFIPSAAFSPVYFGAISGAITSLFAVFALLSARKIY